MSSITLKQFMTRGMEKRGADFQFNIDGSSGPFVTWNADKGYNTSNFNQTDLSGYLSNLYTDSGEEYWKSVDPYTRQRLIYELSSLLHEVVPRVIRGDDDLLKQIDNSKSVKVLLGSIGAGKVKPSEFITQAISDMTKDSNFRKFMLGAYKNNPDLIGSFADKYIIQSVMKKMGLDPSKVYDYAPGLKAYDMNQHLPGMAAAFGIPFGIGALTGHPGWGALLGLLGAGGYGYYKYNQMAGADPSQETNKDQLFNTPPSTKYLAGRAYAENTEALPDLPAPATEAAPAVSGPTGGESSGDEMPGLEDTLNTEIEPILEEPAPAPATAVAPQPSAPAVEKKNNPVVQQSTFYPWRVVSKDAKGAPVSVWTKKGGPGGTQYTKGRDGKWYLGDGRSWFPKPASPGDVGAIEEAIRSGNYLLDNSIPNLPGNITFMGEDGTVYNDKKAPLGIVRNNKFRPEREKLQPESMSIHFNSIDDIQDILKPAGDLRVDANGGIFVNNSRVGLVNEDGVVSLWPETLPGTDLSSGKPATYWYDQSDFREAYPDAAWQDSDDRKSYVIRDKNNRLLAYTISKKPDSWVGVFPKYVDLWGLGTELTTQPPTEAPARPEAPSSTQTPTSVGPKPPARSASTTPTAVPPTQPTAPVVEKKITPQFHNHMAFDENGKFVGSDGTEPHNFNYNEPVTYDPYTLGALPPSGMVDILDEPELWNTIYDTRDSYAVEHNRRVNQNLNQADTK